MKKVVIIAAVMMLFSVPAMASIAIDGTISAGEWDGAATYTIGNGGGTAYLQADVSYVYGAFDITPWTSASGAYSHGNLLGFGVSSQNTPPGYPAGKWVELQQATNNQNWGGDGYSGIINGLESAFRINAQSPPAASIPVDLQAMDSFATGHRVWEVKIPISTLGVVAGDTIWVVGGINFEGAQNWYPNELLWESYAPVVIPIPEPATMMLLGLGAVLLRKKK
jgi:hypothetical protein